MVSHEAWISPICILLRPQVKCITTLYTFYFSCVIKPQQIRGEIEAILDLTRQWQCLIKEYRGGLQGHKQTSTVGHSKLNKIGSLFLKIKDKWVKYRLRARHRHLFWFYDLNKININFEGQSDILIILNLLEWKSICYSLGQFQHQLSNGIKCLMC